MLLTVTEKTVQFIVSIKGFREYFKKVYIEIEKILWAVSRFESSFANFLEFDDNNQF